MMGVTTRVLAGIKIFESEGTMFLSAITDSVPKDVGHVSSDGSITLIDNSINDTIDRSGGSACCASELLMAEALRMTT